jgi:hypothetical protein
MGGGSVSESQHLPAGKSTTELAIESFVDKMIEIHPDLDWEEFHDAISGCVHEAVPSANEGEGSSGGEE